MSKNIDDIPGYRVMTKAEKEFRRQQEYWRTGAKRETKWLKK